MAGKRAHQITNSGTAPVGGLNVRDAINAMPGIDALELVNWIPQQYGVRARKGYREWCTNLDSEVKTVMSYQPDRADIITGYQLFGCTDSNIYDVTESSATPPVSAALAGTLDAGRFTSTMFANTAGQFLLACPHNGGYRYYDGAAWSVPAFGSGVGEIDGLNPSQLVFVTQWKRRAWFVEKASTSVWYLPTDQVTGDLAELDVGPFLAHGGSVAFIANWTIDAGEGIDDFLVIAGENGDILVYKGTDPTSIATFQLVGRWYIGALPLGRRNFAHFGGDLLILSQLGLQPLSYVTRGGQSLLRSGSVDYIGKIQPLLAELVAGLSEVNGWDVLMFPREQLLIINKPTGGVNVYDQYSLYTNTNAWCKFTGIPMVSFHVTDNKMFFGTVDGRVCEGLTGFFDEVPLGDTIGNGIGGTVQWSYNYFGLPGAYKQFLMVRPTFLATDRPAVVAQMLADFQAFVPAGQPVYTDPEGARWDVSRWDESQWAGSLNTYQDWFGAMSFGYTGSCILTTVTVGDTFLVAIDYMYERGGPL